MKYYYHKADANHYEHYFILDDNERACKIWIRRTSDGEWIESDYRGTMRSMITAKRLSKKAFEEALFTELL